MPKKHSKDTEYDPGKHYPYPNEDEGAERPPFPEGLPGAQPHPGDWLGQLYPSGGAISNNRKAAMLASLLKRHSGDPHPGELGMPGDKGAGDDWYGYPDYPFSDLGHPGGAHYPPDSVHPEEIAPHPDPGITIGILYPGETIQNNRQAAMLARLMWAASKGAQPRPSPGQVLRNAGFQHGNVLRAYANWLRQSNGSL